MRKVIFYKIARSEDSINKMLGKGYELYGSPYTYGTYNINQAMIKYETKEPKLGEGYNE